MDHFVNIERLPDGLEFPPDLRERIYFDAERKKLVCRGYMSKSDFDRISQLTRDWGFRRKLEELFRMSVMHRTERPSGFRRLLGALRKFLPLG